MMHGTQKNISTSGFVIFLARTLGYAVLPGGPANKDGVVIQYNVFGTTGKLLRHLIKDVQQLMKLATGLD